MKKYLLVCTSAALFLVSAVHVYAQINNIPNPIGLQTIPQLISAVATYVAAIVGSLAVIMFILAGIFLLTSGLYPENLQRGKDTLKWAAIGLVIAISGAGLVALIRNILGG